MANAIYVVIPYFQKQPGILRRALDSVARQQVQREVRVVIVDDASPVSPHTELEHSALPPALVTIVPQPNAGPGAARNRGLDHIPDDAEFVAFLDSDDEWSPSHLQNAGDALGNDLDFYFSNHREPDTQSDRFAQHGRLDLSRHTALNRGSHCYRYEGDMIDQIMFANVIETSTVVYRWSRFRQLRFRNDFKSAFEDILFWISALQSSRGIAFTADVECQYGRGVSIWRSTGFGSDRTLARLIDERRYCREINGRFVRTRAQQKKLKAKISGIRQAVVADVLHRLRRRMPIDVRGLAKFARIDPVAMLFAVPIALRVARKKYRDSG